MAVGVFWPARVLPEDDGATAGTVPGGSSGAALAAQLSAVFPGADQCQTLQVIGDAVDNPRAPVSGAGGIFNEAGALLTPQKADYDEDAPLGRPDRIGVDIEKLAEHVCGSALDVLRLFTYAEMKNRAGVVGQAGLGPLLLRLGQDARVRIHLMGHSFGARLVAHSLAGLGPAQDAQDTPIKSLVLIQGAFSHFSFASAIIYCPEPGTAGALAPLAGLVDGPLLATFSAADRALGEWYPMASMLQHEDLALLDHPVYRWGAMGHDGFQQATAVTRPLQRQGSRYDLARGGFYRLDANAVINADQSRFSGAHSDICHAEILWAAVSAAGLV
ncbi:hypothetical protein ACIRYZ_28800 [Kitasatospora sp. NPDC101155]|uniref:hypothetical protein n=1 Tax=Kitasatospora sp. NPDC101155 TaxID=3364097 RepID=UPI00380EC11C